MSFDNFLFCLKFLSHNPKERIGLIGGEPTLYPQFQQVLSELINSPFSSVCLFTNGILLDRYFNELRNSKFQILVNLNAPDIIGIENYLHTIDNIQEMIERLYMRDQVGISLNIYSADQDFDYIIRVLQDYHCRKLRLSIAVPNLDVNRSMDSIIYFEKMLPSVRKLIKKLLQLDIAPVFDCNYIPPCMMTEEDRQLFSQYEKTIKRSNLLVTNPVCTPVLDILPDLHVVRCFGMSSAYKAYLADFQNTDELQRHFLMQIDALAYHILPSEKCRGCKEYFRMRCSGGCYAYRQKTVMSADTLLNTTFGGIT